MPAEGWRTSCWAVAVNDNTIGQTKTSAAVHHFMRFDRPYGWATCPKIADHASPRTNVASIQSRKKAPSAMASGLGLRPPRRGPNRNRAMITNRTTRSIRGCFLTSVLTICTAQRQVLRPPAGSCVDNTISKHSACRPSVVLMPAKYDDCESFGSQSSVNARRTLVRTRTLIGIRIVSDFSDPPETHDLHWTLRIRRCPRKNPRCLAARGGNLRCQKRSRCQEGQSPFSSEHGREWWLSLSAHLLDHGLLVRCPED